jgi:manganese/iron transport system permease protein/iron/zinc/copper transport system permease protein
VSVLTIAFVFFGYKQLLFNTFDPEVAPAYGVRAGAIDTMFSLVLAAAIIASMRILGVTLIAAAIVIPPTVARLLTDSFSRMLVLSAVLGAVNGFVGLYLSYYLDSSSGSTIVLLGTATFVVALLYASARERRYASRRTSSQPLAVQAEGRVAFD